MEDNHAVREYIEQSWDFLEKARQYVAVGDLHQASEKGWRAASHMAKAVAAANGWNYETHVAFFGVIQRAADEAEEPRLVQWGAMANLLHTFYYMRKTLIPSTVVGRSVEEIGFMIQALETLTSPSES